MQSISLLSSILFHVLFDEPLTYGPSQPGRDQEFMWCQMSIPWRFTKLSMLQTHIHTSFIDSLFTHSLFSAATTGSRRPPILRHLVFGRSAGQHTRKREREEMLPSTKFYNKLTPCLIFVSLPRRGPLEVKTFFLLLNFDLRRLLSLDMSLFSSHSKFKFNARTNEGKRKEQEKEERFGE